MCLIQIKKPTPTKCDLYHICAAGYAGLDVVWFRGNPHRICEPPLAGRSRAIWPSPGPRSQNRKARGRLIKQRNTSNKDQTTTREQTNKHCCAERFHYLIVVSCDKNNVLMKRQPRRCCAKAGLTTTTLGAIVMATNSLSPPVPRIYTASKPSFGGGGGLREQTDKARSAAKIADHTHERFRFASLIC